MEEYYFRYKERAANFFDPVTVREAIGNLPTPTESGIIRQPLPLSSYENI